MVLFASELLAERLTVLLVEVGHRESRGHVHMGSNRLIQCAQVIILASSLLNGGSCRMRQRVDVDNITRYLVIVYTDLNSAAGLAGFQSPLADVIQTTFNGNQQIVMKILQDILFVDIIQVRHPHDFCKYIRLLNQLPINDEVMLAVSVVVGNFKIHKQIPPNNMIIIFTKSIIAKFINHFKIFY